MAKMNEHDTRELAALAALDCLDAGEEASLDGAEQSVLREEVDSYKTVIEGLGFLADEVRPPAHLDTRLRALIQARKGAPRSEKKVERRWFRWPDTESDDGLTIVDGEKVAWEPLSEGIQVKNLFVNREENKVTMLVKMAAGHSYTPHVHFGPEECYVLSGDLYSDHFSMKAGDFQRAEPGSKHGVQATKNGCVILITSSLNDELIDRETAGTVHS